MERHTVQSRNDGQLDFRGEQVGKGSSRHGQRERWYEVDLYETDAGALVAHVRGCSTVEGELTRHDCIVTQSPYEMLEFLAVRHAGDTYVPRSSVLALSQAAGAGTRSVTKWKLVYQQATELARARVQPGTARPDRSNAAR